MLIFGIDQDMFDDKVGTFNILDARSHRLARVCRSLYTVETYNLEEGVDRSEMIRGILAE